MPSLAYFLSSTDHPIDDNHPLWPCPLPDNRRGGGIENDGTDTVTYGDYFSAVTDFCAADGWKRILTAATHQLARPVVREELTHLSIFLEKHGAFYHPARLRATIADQELTFAGNVAASGRGRRALPREVAALKHLNAARPFGWFPTLYDDATAKMPIFLADWLEDFHEFHLTDPTSGDPPAIVVWDGTADGGHLSVEQTTDLYRLATMILTACYDLTTSHQVLSWHHAAGDFVVRVDDEGVAVRLITVRDYGPMSGVGVKPGNERVLLDALVIFFLHLSMRMRLDRLDGVDAVVWSPGNCLAPMVEGFFQGLDLSGRISGFPEAFPQAFRSYFNHHEEGLLLDTASQISQGVYDQRSEERQVIERHLSGHIRQIRRIMTAG